MPTNIRIKRIQSISDIDVTEWNLSDDSMDIFHSIPFLTVLEKAKVEDSQIFYWLAERDEVTVATAVFSIFKISLDLFIGDNAVVRRINKAFPNFFKVTILFCGTPVSIGHKNLVIKNERDIQTSLELLEKEMKTLAKKYGVKHLIIKEFDDVKRETFGSELLKNNWFEGYSIPDVKLKIRWSSYENYLTSMRSSFRRQIKNALKKLNNGQEVNSYSDFFSKHFKILRANEIDVEDFFEKYIHVMNRAEVKLETLNLAFFQQLFITFQEEIRVFTYEYENGNLSYFFTIHQDNRLYFLWTAREENKDGRDIYFNLFQAMMNYAIEQEVDFFHLGQTAYYAKMRIGGIPEQRYIYYKCLNPLQHRILKALRLVLFPELKLKPLNIFRTSLF